MAPKAPTLDQMRQIAADYKLHLSDADLAAFQGLMAGTLASYNRLDQLVEPALPGTHANRLGGRPAAEDNELGAWYWRGSIKGEGKGPLTGKTVAIKDNICVAGVPMMNGSSVLEGYTPEADATVVTRILQAGGEIAGKAVCEHLCFSGSSFTSDTGPVRNPHDPTRTSGGSSSGAAALVANGDVDMAIGGDQGGSVRIPASWCGVFGLKPTHGLVPYTGAFPIELTLDHLGPITRTVPDLALLLEVIAGDDGLDPRQRGVRVERYTDALRNDAAGLRIGVVREGFDWPDASEADVDSAVRAAAASLGKLGADVKEVSIPIHRDGLHIWNAIAVEGATALMVRGNGMGTNWKGHYTTSLLDAYARGRLTRADDLSDTVKLVLLLGQHMQDSYHGRYYAKAQNLSRTLAKAYDDALASFDILLMPTLPMKATTLPGTDATLEERVGLALGMLQNTSPFDVTGHPAITVPCAMSEGLPIGMMLVGRHWDESRLLQAAHAFEQTGAYSVDTHRPTASNGWRELVTKGRHVK